MTPAFFTASAMTVAALLGLAPAACTPEAVRRGELEATAFPSYGIVGDLPAAAPVPVRYAEADTAYRWAERAYGLDQAFYRNPPDYGFDYGGAQPWVWETEDDWRMYAEPTRTGYRNYYYEPNQRSPYFVRDNQYGYGFDQNGTLTSLFDLAGRLLPAALANQQAPTAGSYLTRALQLQEASRTANRLAVPGDLWLAQSPKLLREQDAWFQGAQNNQDWLAYRDRSNWTDVAAFESEWRRREERLDQLAQGPNPPPWAPAWGLRENRGETVWRAKDVRKALKEDRKEAKRLAKAEDGVQVALAPDRGGPGKAKGHDKPDKDRGGGDRDGKPGRGNGRDKD